MKKEMPGSEPYKGVRDFYPDEWERLSAIWDKTRDTLSRGGYEEYNASPLERAELYESKGNEEIINEQTYTFEDRGGRRVTLRPEMTPTLARMVAAKRRELPFPLRWFSIGNRFRYERPQKGRLREFYQTDVDLVGLPEGEADVEIVGLAHDILMNLGARTDEFIIRINSRALLGAACKAAGYSDEEGARAYWRLLDKKSKMTQEEFAAAGGSTKKSPLAIIETASNPVVKKEKERLLAMLATLKTRGVANAVFDPEIVRGFDYYTGMIFEIFDTNPANPRSLFGGGRYDGLVALFGGEPIPAVGFAIGDVTLSDFLATHGHETSVRNRRPQVFIGTPSAEDMPAAQEFAARLRGNGVRTFMNLRERGLGDQVKEADKRGIALFLAYGEKERSSGTVRVKTLATGKEQAVPISDIATFLNQDI